MNVDDFRAQIDEIDYQILSLLCRRVNIVREIAAVGVSELARFADPRREQEILNRLNKLSPGVLAAEDISAIFREIFRSSLKIKIENTKLLALRSSHPDDTIIDIRGFEVGGKSPVVIAGPCSIESEDQLLCVAQELVGQGVHFLRGGAFKPRTSPYAFQGLGREGFEILSRVAAATNLVSVSEVMDARDIDFALQHVDVLQVGARNMANYSLLKELGKCDHPVILKRGMGSTIEELLFAAEYILASGNAQVILCERGIRTFENLYRYTLDVAAVAILKQRSHLPVIADASHSGGHRDLVFPLAKASLAAGADGVMIEVHPVPSKALSDKEQQLDFDEFRRLIRELTAHYLER